MKSSTTLLLLVGVLLLGGFIWFVERKGDTTDERRAREKKAFRVDPEATTTLGLVSGDLDVECAREDDLWLLTRPVRGRAAGGEIDRIISGLENLERVDTISLKEQRRRQLDLADFGLEEPRARFVLGEDGRRRTIRIGRAVPGGEAVYAKEEASEEVVVAQGTVMDLVPESLEDLRERSLFAGNTYDVNRMEVRRAGGFMQVAKQDNGTWRIQQPLPARADSSRVSRLLDKLFALRIKEFVTDTLSDPAAYGLDEGAVQVALWTHHRGEPQRLLLGKRLEEDDLLVYARLDTFDSVYSVPAEMAADLNVKAEDLRDRRLLALAPYDVSAIRIEEGERTLALEKQADAPWTMTTPVQWKADERQVSDLLQNWTATRIETFIDDIGTNLAEKGMVPPFRVLTLTRRVPSVSPDAGAGPERVETTVVQINTAPRGSTALAHVEGENALYEVPAGILDAISLDPLFYRDRDILGIQASDIRRITVGREGRTQVVTRDEAGSFAVSGASTGAVDADAVEDLLGVICPLRVLRFVQQDPADLAVYGLQNPKLVLTLGLSGEAGIERSILFGEDVGEDGVYAMLRGEDVICVVEKALASLLQRDLYAEVSPPEE